MNKKIKVKLIKQKKDKSRKIKYKLVFEKLNIEKKINWPRTKWRKYEFLISYIKGVNYKVLQTLKVK